MLYSPSPGLWCADINAESSVWMLECQATPHSMADSFSNGKFLIKSDSSRVFVNCNTTSQQAMYSFFKLSFKSLLFFGMKLYYVQVEYWGSLSLQIEGFIMFQFYVY